MIFLNVNKTRTLIKFISYKMNKLLIASKILKQIQINQKKNNEAGGLHSKNWIIFNYFNIWFENIFIIVLKNKKWICYHLTIP